MNIKTSRTTHIKLVLEPSIALSRGLAKEDVEDIQMDAEILITCHKALDHSTACKVACAVFPGHLVVECLVEEI